MPKVKGSIPNLVNGVSQQSPSLRLSSQGEISDNYYPTLVDGLTKRPPTEFLASLPDAFPGAFTHFILRDEDEKYVLIIEECGDVRVFDLDGVEKTVTNNGASYLTGLTNPAKQLKALTVADHTFIINTTRVVEPGTATAPTRPYEALVNVQAGNYGRTYRISINGDWEAEYQTPDGDQASEAPYIDTVQIAAQLYNDLEAANFDDGDWAIGRYHSTVYIRNTAEDFSLGTEDGFNGRAMKGVKKQVQKFTDLPLHGPGGVVVKITGSESGEADDYWVEFVKDHETDGEGIWRECPAPGTVLGVDASTMPHLLVRNANGTFTFKPAEWEGRKCGDEEANPDPSFVGQTIDDVFFTKNRLGLLTGENAVLSQSGNFWNFYRTTVMVLLDTDPIDVAASHIKVSILKHAVPFQGAMLLFSDRTQFALKGNELFSPKTAHTDALTELTTHPLIRPEVVGTSIYFVAERDTYASLYDYFIDKQLENADYDDVSDHVPIYVPGGVHTMATSADLKLVILATSGDPSALYTYQFHWQGQERLQSAWSRWTFEDAEIVNMAFDKSSLVILMRRNGRLQIERLRAEQGYREKVYLDSRVELIGTYDDDTDTTTFTLPYTAPESLRIVSAAGGPVVPEGVELTPLSVDDDEVVIEGDYTDQPFYLGAKYDSRFRFSELFYRDPQSNTAIQDGRLQVLAMSVNYARSAYFKVEVTPLGRGTRTYLFNGRIIGDPDNVLGEIVLDHGKLAFPVMSRSDRVTIDLVSDSWLPCSFSSADWRGVFNPNKRQ